MNCNSDVVFFCFPDLAGSETYDKALGGTRGNVDRKKVEELKTINLSLTNLTTCINYLSKGRMASYRSSQLTFYLMDSLGGNSKTTLVVAASPHIFNRSETIRTLNFAKTAKSVKNTAKVNQELSKEQLLKLVKKLKKENKKLKAQLALFEAELLNNGIELPVDIASSPRSRTSRKHKQKRSQSLTPRTVLPESMTESTTLMGLPEDDAMETRLRLKNSVSTNSPLSLKTKRNKKSMSPRSTT